MEEKGLEYVDKAILHMNFSNRRMLIALVTVCLTFILTIIVFVVGYTIRERNWQDTLLKISPSVEVKDGTESLQNS